MIIASVSQEEMRRAVLCERTFTGQVGAASLFFGSAKMAASAVINLLQRCLLLPFGFARSMRAKNMKAALDSMRDMRNVLVETFGAFPRRKRVRNALSLAVGGAANKWCEQIVRAAVRANGASK